MKHGDFPVRYVKLLEGILYDIIVITVFVIIEGLLIGI